MRPKYCYWSVCSVPYAPLMEACVKSARRAGVFKDFHILCERPIAGCICYDCQGFDRDFKLFKLLYLKAGMGKLNFDYYVWVDADTLFANNPVGLISLLSKSPIHIPLETDLTSVDQTQSWNGLNVKTYIDLASKEGVSNPVHLCRAAFWVVHHDAINTVFDLSMEFWHRAKAKGVELHGAGTLGYTMQMLCADYRKHLRRDHPDIWASDDHGCFRDRDPDGNPWGHTELLSPINEIVNPSIIHVPRRKPDVLALAPR